MKAVLEFLIDVMARRAHARVIEELDERTLRDIGLDFEANQARERSRLGARFESY